MVGVRSAETGASLRDPTLRASSLTAACRQAIRAHLTLLIMSQKAFGRSLSQSPKELKRTQPCSRCASNFRTTNHPLTLQECPSSDLACTYVYLQLPRTHTLLPSARRRSASSFGVRTVRQICGRSRLFVLASSTLCTLSQAKPSLPMA